MKPSPRLLAIAAALMAPGIAVALFPEWITAFYGLVGVVVVATIVDALLVLSRRPVGVTRTAPSSLAVGVWADALVRLENTSARAQQVDVFDGVPDACEFEGLPRRVIVPPRSAAQFTYRLRAMRRGDATLAAAHVLRDSPLRLWQRAQRGGGDHVVRVFPDFATVARLSLAALDRHIQLLGLKRRQRRGEGFEFRQLRDYAAGDPLRRVDWKATSRRRKLISREYQEERDQQVLFVLDCGRRMRAMDGGLSHFDHCLNALLVVASVALRQGDSVGLVSFGGADRRLAPVKGRKSLRTLQNVVYDLQPTLETSDFVEAAERVRMFQSRRALVLFVTNQRDDDEADLVPALELLRRRHLVVVASLRESTIEGLQHEPIASLESAATNCAAHGYTQARAHVLERLRRPGVIPLDTDPRRLAVELAHQYLEIKRSGRL